MAPRMRAAATATASGLSLCRILGLRRPASPWRGCMSRLSSSSSSSSSTAAVVSKSGSVRIHGILHLEPKGACWLAWRVGRVGGRSVGDHDQTRMPNRTQHAAGLPRTGARTIGRQAGRHAAQDRKSRLLRVDQSSSSSSSSSSPLEQAPGEPERRRTRNRSG
ncbi:hypothetical protein IWZ00DRAFT_20236 [Phyllosticta capitalensis]